MQGVWCRGAGKQGSKEGRGAGVQGELGCRGARDARVQECRGAGMQGSWGAGGWVLGCRGTGVQEMQGCRGAGEQGCRGADLLAQERQAAAIELDIMGGTECLHDGHLHSR